MHVTVADWLLAILIAIVGVVVILTIFLAPAGAQEFRGRSMASITCTDVRQAVAQYGLRAAEQAAVQAGMTNRQRLKALACLGMAR